ncbi:apolipoprotein A-II [Hyperolius riggenbachi]|uniref:apolipoprotein A-II n=1 Tax=Hyperolius riggenbachi TaxID=752182 RepID=UPI0035A37271
MKVLALVVLVIAISGLEAGVVKREADDLFQFQHFSDFFSKLGESLKKYGEDIKDKFNNGEIQSNTEKLGSQIQQYFEPIRTHAESWAQQWSEKIKQ